MITLDTNILVYAIDQAEPEKGQVAAELVERAQLAGAIIGLQVCGEFYSVATRRMRRSVWEAAQATRNLLTAFDAFPASRAAVERALAEAGAARFSYWDALLLAAAEESGCTVMFSEDIADGARLGRLEVVHAFGPAGLSERAQRILQQLGC